MQMLNNDKCRNFNNVWKSICESIKRERILNEYRIHVKQTQLKRHVKNVHSNVDECKCVTENKFVLILNNKQFEYRQCRRYRN